MTIDISFAAPRQSRQAVTPRICGQLTTEHAASSHGLPVVVLEDGTALGPGEVSALHVTTYVETDDVNGRDVHRTLTADEHALIAAARLAGYVVELPREGEVG